MTTASQRGVETLAASQLPCVHCGQLTPVTEDRNPATVFCCQGCVGAYQLIHGWGLQDFYALRNQMQLGSSPLPAEQGGGFEQFDEPEFLGPSAPVRRDDGTCWSELAVHGLHCAACAWLIEKAAETQPGWLSARVRMNHHTIQVAYDSNQTKLSEIARLLDRLGYQLAPFDRSGDQHLHQENRRHLIQIAIAGFLAANAMWIAVALYAGEFATVAADHRYFLTLVGTALGLTAVVWPGRTFLTGARSALRTWTPHMDLPIALGLTVGATVGTINALLGTGHVYFDSLATLVFLLLIGRWIQFRQQQRAARAVDLMLRITPRHATLISRGEPHRVLVDTLSVGDVIAVGAGQSVPADGTIVDGDTKLDRSLITGESIPVGAGPGDVVAAGIVNVASPIQVCVTAIGRDSRIGRVMQAVESAASERTPIVMLADRIGGYFVLSVMALAVVTFLLWLRQDISAATSNATALLIVACPCALALATPLAIAVGLGRAAKSGILIRDGRALQRLAGRGQIWLDKTGTLTEGRQRISSMLGDESVLPMATALQQDCSHPVAQAMLREAQQRGYNLAGWHVSDATVVDGGILGVVDSCEVRIGNLRLMQTQYIENWTDWKAEAAKLAEAGESPVYVAVNGQIRLLLGLADPLRPDAVSTINELKRQGWNVGILSGDHPEIVKRIGRLVGLDEKQCTGGMTPEAKLAKVREARFGPSAHTTIMVGDGANDAAALASADVGIAVRGGAEVSLQAAPVFIASGRLSSIPLMLIGARRTTRLVVAAVAVSLAYNMVAVTLAMLGWISPFVAAILMPISSVSVLAMILAIKTFPSEATV